MGRSKGLDGLGAGNLNDLEEDTQMQVVCICVYTARYSLQYLCGG